MNAMTIPNHDVSLLASAPSRKEPTQAQIKDIAPSIQAHLERFDRNWQSAAKEYLDNCDVPELGRAMRDGDLTEAGRILLEGTRDYLRMESEEIAAEWLADDVTRHHEAKLRGWRHG